MRSIINKAANLLTRTRKTIGPQDLRSFLSRIRIFKNGIYFSVSYPHDSKTDPHRKFKEIARYELISYYTRNKTVLDIGSGSFYGAAMLAREAKQVYGVELSSIAVLQAKLTWRKVGNLSCWQGKDLSRIPVKVDSATCINVIEHLPRTAALNLLKEIADKLEPGGNLILATPQDRSKFRMGKYENPDHIKEYSNQELAELVTEAGFQPAAHYMQNMNQIRSQRETNFSPEERAWFIWILRK
jgi:2-polyprenyl-3-methyl-5-hydroxy-6-metoxy-1,4-benzoquinol methylase